MTNDDGHANGGMVDFQLTARLSPSFLPSGPSSFVIRHSSFVIFGTPCLRVGKKLMARLWEDGETLVAKVELEERVRLLDQHPDVFFLTDHYLNYPCILVRLDAVPLDQLRVILDGAWRKVASKRQLAALPKKVST